MDYHEGTISSSEEGASSGYITIDSQYRVLSTMTLYEWVVMLKDRGFNESRIRATFREMRNWTEYLHSPDNTYIKYSDYDEYLVFDADTSQLGI